MSTAVHEDRLAVDVRAVVREQERQHRRDVLGRAEAWRPYRGEDLVPEFLGGGPQGGLGQDHPWCHEVAAHATLATESGSMPSEPDQTALRRLVSNVLGFAH